MPCLPFFTKTAARIRTEDPVKNAEDTKTRTIRVRKDDSQRIEGPGSIAEKWSYSSRNCSVKNHSTIPAMKRLFKFCPPRSWQNRFCQEPRP